MRYALSPPPLRGRVRERGHLRIWKLIFEVEEQTS